MGNQRRRSTSAGSLSESPVAPYLWQISPTTQQSPPISSSTQMLQQGSFLIKQKFQFTKKSTKNT